MDRFHKLYKLLVIYILVFYPAPIDAEAPYFLNLNHTARQLHGNISLVNKTINDQKLTECTKNVALLVGWLPEKGEIDKEGIYSRIVQAYHYSWPAAEYWYEAIREYQNQRRAMINIREMQKDWEYLRGYHNTCSEALKIFSTKVKLKKFDEGFTETGEELHKCLYGDVISEVRSNEFGRRVMKTCQIALDVVLNALLLSSDNTQVKHFYKPFEVALFARMYNETLDWDLEIHERLNNTFPQYIGRLRQEGNQFEANETQKKFVEIKERMGKYPYNLLYFNGDEEAIEEFRKWGVGVGDTGFESLAFHMYNLFYDMNSTDTKKPYYYLREDWSDDFNEFEKDWKDGVFEKYRMRAEKLYQTYLHVEAISEEEGGRKSERNEEGVLIGDGLWDWNIEGNGIHNMRLAWELMGAVLEEIKCYMRESYYFDLREEAIENTQLGFEQENKLFSGISRTMFTGCRISNDTDLVSPYCTRENHEICAPIGPLDDRQRPESIHHGGLSVLKPRWIYKLKENKTTLRKECVARKDYVIQMNHCRCGFRMDCGKDLGVNITCQLEANDLLRGQCRGGVGYPCKTLPLAKGKYHQTCKSGYCNMKTNSCEERPYRDSKSLGYSYRVVGRNGNFVLICLLKLTAWKAYLFK